LFKNLITSKFWACHFLTITKIHLLLEQINSLNSSLLMLLMLSVKSGFSKIFLMAICQKNNFGWNYKKMWQSCKLFGLFVNSNSLTIMTVLCWNSRSTSLVSLPSTENMLLLKFACSFIFLNNRQMALISERYFQASITTVFQYFKRIWKKFKILSSTVIWGCFFEFRLQIRRIFRININFWVRPPPHPFDATTWFLSWNIIRQTKVSKTPSFYNA
jgi:hypothetical protein